MLYDDLKAAPGQVLKDIFEFLDIDSVFEPDTSATPNVSGEPKFRRMHQLIRNAGFVKLVINNMLPTVAKRNLRDIYFSHSLRRPPMTDEVRDYLVEIFRADIKRTQDLIDQDLTHWLK